MGVESSGLGIAEALRGPNDHPCASGELRHGARILVESTVDLSSSCLRFGRIEVELFGVSV